MEAWKHEGKKRTGKKERKKESRNRPAYKESLYKIVFASVLYGNQGSEFLGAFFRSLKPVSRTGKILVTTVAKELVVIFTARYGNKIKIHDQLVVECLV